MRTIFILNKRYLNKSYFNHVRYYQLCVSNITELTTDAMVAINFLRPVHIDKTRNPKQTKGQLGTHYYKRMKMKVSIHPSTYFCIELL
jgi:hypothetical protein